MIKRLSVITSIVVMLLFAYMYAEKSGIGLSGKNVVMEIEGMACSL